jgi:hypothetical protein
MRSSVLASKHGTERGDDFAGVRDVRGVNGVVGNDGAIEPVAGVPGQVLVEVFQVGGRDEYVC